METVRLRILLIDDDDDDHVILRDVIRESDLDADLVGATSFDLGVEHLGTGDFDVCLVDYRLGARTGVDLLILARDQAWSTPMILLTGQDTSEVDVSALRSGAEDYLVKSELTASLLSRAVRYAIERAKVNQRLRDSEDRYALAARGANDGIWDWDLRSDEIFYSDRWKSMLGHTADEIAPNIVEWFDRVHPKDQDRLREELEAHIRGGTPSFRCEHRMRHRDGTYLWVLNRGVAVRDGQGRSYRVAGSQTDVSSRREQEEELLSHVTHELRTPLNALYQYTSLVYDGVLGDLAPKQKEILGRALQNVDQLKAMIGDLMHSTRIQNGKFAVEPIPMYLPKLIDESLNSLRPSATMKGIELLTSLDSQLPPVFGDPDRIRQILINLCDNAMKFTDPGGTITIFAGESAAEPAMACISVRDTGCGISAEATQVVFERLNQAQASTEASRKGLGLGLHICKEIARRQGGRIWVESELGVGSEFFVTVPLFRVARMLEDTLPAVPDDADCISVLELYLDSDGQRPLPKEVLRDAQAIATGSIIAELDVVIPTWGGHDEEPVLRVVSYCDSAGAHAMAERLGKRFAQEGSFRWASASLKVDTLAIPPREDRAGPKERLKQCVGLVENHLESRSPSLIGV